MRDLADLGGSEFPASDMIAGDFDHDGRPDLLVAKGIGLNSTPTNPCSVLLNRIPGPVLAADPREGAGQEVWLAVAQ